MSPSTDSETLDALRFPLHGSRLIEASAGTGKTWTIAALYVRLVLGHGEPGTAFTRALLPSEILVMTFTRAATRELSARIRGRLLEAAACFREAGRPGTPDAAHAPDDFLDRLAQAYPPGAARAQAARRLTLAAEMMDEAAVLTIDAWCQRMLREHAFDSGSLFEEELSADVGALVHDAVHDYWRQQLYPLDDETLAGALDAFPSIDRLKAMLAAYLRLDPVQVHGMTASAHGAEEDLAQVIAAAREHRAAALRQLKQGWADRAQGLRVWLDGVLRAADSPLSKASLKENHRNAWFDQLVQWAQDPQIEALDLKKGWERLSPAGLQEACKAGRTAPEHPDLAALAALRDALADLPTPRAAMIRHAAGWVRRRLAVLKRQARTFGFDDMLERLDTALAGPNAQALRERIVAQYPVALIDEFQDTSPVQYRIFDRLYDTHGNDAATGLFLIGDPKQSIYAFRGADIHSYLGARRHTAGRHYALGTNFRSTGALVEAVNRVFLHAEGDVGGATEPVWPGYPAGAFQFREGADNPLPFQPARAHGRPERLLVEGAPAAALTFWHDTAGMNNERYRQGFAARCAEQIVRLLNDPNTGFQTDDAPLVRLRPRDIAILVRTGKEAQVMRRALQARQVASVYLSEKDSVFASQEARDIARWLAAVSAPLDARKARAAWAAPTFGLTLAALARLAADDLAWDDRTEQLKQLGAVWRRQGVLAMLRRTLHDLDLPGRLLQAAGGERVLTNFLHLGEALQAQSQLLEGEAALIRWLHEQMNDAGSADDAQLVRLESDTDLVKVVTLHKSKGLEYPLVFLPFCCGFRQVDKRERAFLHYAEPGGEQHIDFTCSPHALARADAARLQEDLRLLYVGMTRARHALWLGVAALQHGDTHAGGETRSASEAPAVGTVGTVGTVEAVEAVGAVGAVGAVTTVAMAEVDKADKAEKAGKTGKGHRAPRPMLQHSALGYLLAGGAPIDALELPARLGAIAAGCASIVMTPMHGQPARTALARRADAAALLPAPLYRGAFDRAWSIASFSSLARDVAHAAGGAAPAPGQSAREEVLLEMMDEAAPAVRPADQPWHAFPRGAVPGNFLHEQLEWLAGEGFACAASPEFERALESRCERVGWGHRKAETVAWLRAVATTELPPLGAPLAALATQLPEMEFWFPSDRFDSQALDALCAQHLLPGRPRPSLPQRQMHGMLRGFMDLVFEWQGKYWVLDYKSNALGHRDADYHRDALADAVLAHRYDVQAALYLLALHRLLSARLGDAYRPQTHLGGTLFLFLRGIAGPERGCHVAPASQGLLDALDACLRDAATYAAVP